MVDDVAKGILNPKGFHKAFTEIFFVIKVYANNSAIIQGGKVWL
jgi:hypothetical protein